ncbi:MAG: hypothetical protein HFH68_10265 [Lachnospiraceae bacterium]|nr:hypothetical protein [Lachnospiraceae bacterium]
MKRKETLSINIKQIKIKDSFWSHIQKLVIGTVIPYQEKILKQVSSYTILYMGKQRNKPDESLDVRRKLIIDDIYGIIK